ncbi:MAG: hypothetical protein M3Q91_16430 [Acidobacteriota bacterium]|nr:hypothetical protein [Acidobacteriota bacterium]
MKNRRVLLLLALALLSLAATQSGEFWQKKPYQKWSEEECRKLLANSPWAQSHTLSQTIIQPLQSPGVSRPLGSNPTENIESARSPDPLAREDTGRARQARPTLKYQAQFRSALPIRRAIVRLGQINAKYDELTPEQKQAFDQNAETFLAKRFPDTLILYVSYGSNVPIDERELARHWQSQTTDTLKNFVFLILPGGEKIPLSGFVVAQGGSREFQFVFPRTYEGRPLVRAQDKTLQLEFPHPRIRDQRESRVLIAFKAEKMLIDGEVVY